jgi:hypothetical protein
MAGPLDPTRMPNATDTAEFAARAYGYRASSYLTWAQRSTEAQALNPQARSPWKITTTITSPRGAS